MGRRQDDGGDPPPFWLCAEPPPEPGQFYRPTLAANEITGPFTVRGVPVVPFAQNHGFSTTLGFRIGPMAYSTDVTELDDAAFAAIAGVELWIVDCMRRAPHPTHSHLDKTLGWIERVRPRRAVLTHMDQSLDYRALAAELPDGRRARLRRARDRTARPMIRPANAADCAAIEAIVRAAYSIYLDRIGKPPGPMLDDYAAQIAAGTVSVLEDADGVVAAMIVLLRVTTICCSTTSPCDRTARAAALVAG